MAPGMVPMPPVTGAADEAGRDGVHLELPYRSARLRLKVGTGDDGCDGGQEAHVQEDLEIGRLGVDAGKDGRLAVAADA